MTLHMTHIANRLKCSDAHAWKILAIIGNHFDISWLDASLSTINSTIDDAADYHKKQDQNDKKLLADYYKKQDQNDKKLLETKVHDGFQKDFDALLIKYNAEVSLWRISQDYQDDELTCEVSIPNLFGPRYRFNLNLKT